MTTPTTFRDQAFAMARGMKPDEDWTLRFASFLQAAYESGRLSERAAIVSWLRTGDLFAGPTMTSALSQIEQGAHGGGVEK